MSALSDFINEQIEHAKRMVEHNKKFAISDDQDTANYHTGIVHGLQMGIGDMQSVFNVVKEFEKIGAVK